MKEVMPRKTIIGLATIILAVAASYVVYGAWNSRQSQSNAIVLYGNIDIREANLAFNVSGRIDKMLLEEGDSVEPGQHLASLESAIYEAEAEVAEAKMDALQAALNRLRAGSRPEAIREARANVRAISAELEDAQANLLRTAKLTEEDFASKQKHDNDNARVKSLEAQLNAAEEELSLAVQGPRNEDIAEAEAQLRAGDAAYTLASRRLDYTKLYAKGRGVIMTRVTEPGAVVMAYTPVYSVALSDPVWVRTYVSEPDLGRIHPGMKAEVHTDSAPGRIYEGKIGFISPIAEFTPKTVETREVRTSLVYRIRVYVDNPDDSLRQGMPVTITLDVGAGQSSNTAAVLR
jgi:membrane fusion protein YbhG